MLRLFFSYLIGRITSALIIRIPTITNQMHAIRMRSSPLLTFTSETRRHFIRIFFSTIGLAKKISGSKNLRHIVLLFLLRPILVYINKNNAVQSHVQELHRKRNDHNVTRSAQALPFFTDHFHYR
jgi:hypothetical protein